MNCTFMLLYLSAMTSVLWKCFTSVFYTRHLLTEIIIFFFFFFQFLHVSEELFEQALSTKKSTQSICLPESGLNCVWEIPLRQR